MLEVLNPTSHVMNVESDIAPRITDLNNKTIGFLSNSKANLDIFLERLEELLRQRFNFAGIIHAKKGGTGDAASPFPQEEIEKLAATCDVVVNGIGD